MKTFPLTVKDLLLILEAIPEEATLLVPWQDHSYQPAMLHVTTALYDKEHGWTEDFGEDLTPEAEFGERRKVVVVEARYR